MYDRSLRGALIDHFLSVKESPKTLHEGKYYELGNFAGQPYETKPSAAHEVQLRRLGSVVDNIVEVQKSVSFLKDMDGLRIEYRISNLSAIPLTILFAPEFNFALLAGEYPDQYYYHSEPGLKRAALNSIGISERSKRFSLVNESDRFAIHFYFEQPTEIWRYPCETVSLSEAGFEKVYQSSCVLPVYRLAVEKNGIFEAGFQIQIERLHL